MPNKIFNHTLKREFVHKNAIFIIKKLVEANFEAYLVGGAVRDAIQGLTPKDFDIATNALPEQVYKIFRNSRIIGKRFKLVHVYFNRGTKNIIEVATFRRTNNNKHTTHEGLVTRDNVYGSLEEDANRRDFTINSLYYDWFEDCIIDYNNGLGDLKNKTVRMIGDPLIRYQEDPVRILRAIRFMAKLKFKLSVATEKPIQETKKMLGNIPVARLFEEYLKLFHSGTALQVFKLLQQYDLLCYLFPEPAERLSNDTNTLSLYETALSDTDDRLSNNMSINPGYLLAVFLWPKVQEIFDSKIYKDLPPILCMSKIGTKVIKAQRKTLSIPKRFSTLMIDIWVLQLRFEKMQGKVPLRILTHPKYRAAYDFLCLRYRAGATELTTQVDWWTKFQDANKSNQKIMAHLS